MRLLVLTLLLAAPGCVAHHRIVMESEPPGVHVEMNGEYLGETPIVYILASRYAETIWPDNARFVARTLEPGWKPEIKHFPARSPLPGRILFLLERDPTVPAVPETPETPETPEVEAEAPEYETLEEQKRRLQAGSGGS